MSKISSAQILNWDGLECLLIRSDFELLNLALFIHEKGSTWFVLLVLTDSLQNRLPHPDRPKCNSILHLIGSWLFEAAFIGSEYSKHPSSDQVAPIVNDGHKISVPSLSPKPVIANATLSIQVSKLFDSSIWLTYIYIASFKAT